MTGMKAARKTALRLSPRRCWTEPGTYIQARRLKQLGSQKSRLQMAEEFTSATPALMEQVGIQLAIPSQMVAQKTKIAHMPSTDFVLSRGPGLSDQDSFWFRSGSGYIAKQAITSSWARPSILKFYSSKRYTKNGPHMAPIAKVKPSSWIQQSGFSQRKSLMVTPYMMTAMPTRQMEEKKRVMLRLKVEREKVEAMRLTTTTSEQMIVNADTFILCRRYFEKSPPKTLAADRTMKRYAQSVSSRPVTVVQCGMRGPTEATNHPLRKFIRRRAPYCRFLNPFSG